MTNKNEDRWEIELIENAIRGGNFNNKVLMALSSVIAEFKEMQQAQADTKLITYPFPLRDNLLVSLSLPADLTMIDVMRLEQYMTVLVAGKENYGD